MLRQIYVTKRRVVKLPICQNCTNKWTWQQTLKTIFRLNCPYCGKKQYESVTTKKRGILLVPLVLFPYLISTLFNFPLMIAFVMSIIITIIVISVYPFILKLSHKEDPLF